MFSIPPKPVLLLDGVVLTAFWIYMVSLPKDWLAVNGMDVGALEPKEKMLMLGLVQALGVLAGMTAGLLMAAARRESENPCVEVTQRNMCAAYAVGLILNTVSGFAMSGAQSKAGMTSTAIYSYLALGVAMASLNGLAARGCEFKKSEFWTRPLYSCHLPWFFFLVVGVVVNGIFFDSIPRGYEIEFSDRASVLLNVLAKTSVTNAYVMLLLLLAAAFGSNDPGYMHAVGMVLGGGGLAFFYAYAVGLQWWQDYVGDMSSMCIVGGWINAVTSLVLCFVSFHPPGQLDGNLEAAIAARLKGSAGESAYTGLTVAQQQA